MKNILSRPLKDLKGIPQSSLLHICIPQLIKHAYLSFTCKCIFQTPYYHFPDFS